MHNLNDIRALKTRYIRDWYVTRTNMEYRNVTNFRLTVLQGRVAGFLKSDAKFSDNIGVMYRFNFVVLR